MIVGIDLGTSNSLVALWRDGRHELVPNAFGRMLTPSAVTVLDNGEIAVGQVARERLLTHPAQTAAAFKRFMGSDRAILLGGRGFRPEELSALVLKSLKADAETFLGEPVTEAVVTVPAYFSDAQRKATRAAGEIAGLRVERLLNEPTAAALAYGLAQLRESGDEARILVVDLGGGTFDVSILELFHGVMEVRASAGDNFLGGEDFVDVLVDAFIRDVGAAAGLPARASGGVPPPPVHAVLRRQAEWTKIQLSDHEEATLEVPHDGRMLSWTVTQARFAELSAPLLQRLRLPLVRAVRDARLDPDQITHVVLAGGATRMPEIRRMIARTFGKLPFQTINPDEVVARGAAVQAGLKMRDAALDEVVMTDVAPFSLGIDISREGSDGARQSGLFAPVIERNTVIPASREKVFTTARDNQGEIDISIYQGEGRLVRDNVKLGALKVTVPRRKVGEETIRVRFTYDVSGLLEVVVTVNSTGEAVEAVIEGNPGVLTPAQIAERRASLAALKTHPRDQAENMGVLAQAERMYQESLGRPREVLGEMIAEFVAVLDRQDPREIEVHRTSLGERLVQLDRSPFD